jgi:predicted ester cyclase
MSSEENMSTARRLLEQGFAAADYAIVDECVAPDFVEHQNGVEGNGPEAVKDIIRGLHDSFADMTLTVVDTIAGGDQVWLRVRASGTDTKGVGGAPPTGRRFEIDIMDIMRFRDGVIVEHWGVADRLGMLEQLGLMMRRVPRAA